LDDYNYPNFNGVLASFLHKDGYGEDYDPTKDPYCVAYDGYGEDYDPTKDPYCVAYDSNGEDSDSREEGSFAYGAY
jgi:hypothetical protein